VTGEPRGRSVYKFLRAGAVGLYSDFAWPVGEWVEVPPPLVPSRRGVHACRVGDLPHWLDDELWRVELDGEVLELDRMLVATRGRLVERVPTWDEKQLHALAAACVERGRAYSGFGEDAAEWASDPAGAVSAIYIVAHAAGLAAGAPGNGYDAGFAAERAWQAAWLAERLELSDLP
jgi:hypothetical protein